MNGSVGAPKESHDECALRGEVDRRGARRAARAGARRKQASAQGEARADLPGFRRRRTRWRYRHERRSRHVDGLSDQATLRRRRAGQSAPRRAATGCATKALGQRRGLARRDGLLDPAAGTRSLDNGTARQRDGALDGTALTVAGNRAPPARRERHAVRPWRHLDAGQLARPTLRRSTLHEPATLLRRGEHHGRPIVYLEHRPDRRGRHDHERSCSSAKPAKKSSSPSGRWNQSGRLCPFSPVRS